MSLTKEVAIDRIEILEDGQMQIREVTRILEDGVLLSKSFHRHVVSPDSDLTKEDARVVQVCGVVHTPEVVAAHKARKARQREENEQKYGKS